MNVLLLALVPALVVLFYYYNRDRHPEPWGWVAFVFGLGAVAAMVALPLEMRARERFPWEEARGWELFFKMLLVPGFFEESLKLLVVVLAVFWRKDFDEPVDGLIYGTAAALGFTFAEDVRYFSHAGASWARVLTVMAHPWFSCFWAAALGEARLLPRWKGIPLVLVGLAISIFVHGLFDFLVLESQDEGRRWLTYLFVPLGVFLYWAVEHQLEAQHPPAAEEEGSLSTHPGGRSKGGNPDN